MASAAALAITDLPSIKKPYDHIGEASLLNIPILTPSAWKFHHVALRTWLAALSMSIKLATQGIGGTCRENQSGHTPSCSRLTLTYAQRIRSHETRRCHLLPAFGGWLTFSAAASDGTCWHVPLSTASQVGCMQCVPSKQLERLPSSSFPVLHLNLAWSSAPW